jgi:hypothetical protein
LIFKSISHRILQKKFDFLSLSQECWDKPSKDFNKEKREEKSNNIEKELK